MSMRIECSNPTCHRVFNLKIGTKAKRVRCRVCGTVTPVPLLEAPEASLKDSNKRHPARLVCTNCGAVLGVRDAICPGCGGDVRSGITIMKITEEEKRRAGLLHWGSGGKGRTAGARIAVAGVVLLVLLGILFGGALIAG
ncbi:MAG: zinc ribbon domain-containing protein [Planctomycetota bacterium]